MSHRVFQVGVGKMGQNHAKTIEQLTRDGQEISLCGVCDSSLDAIQAFQAQYPHIPAYLVLSAPGRARDFNASSLPPGIEVIASVAEGIEKTASNALMNCTNNNSHIPVLEDALSLRNESGQTTIRTVLQEKPFAHTHEAALAVAEKIRQEGILFSLNSILEFSPIWNDFHHFLQNNGQDLKLRKVVCAYGKDRTQDTRPAQGGWVGLEGIHALDISSVGLKNLSVNPADIAFTSGYLAAGASETGHADYAIACTVHAKDPQGNDIPIQIDGSFAWSEQRRSTLYIYDAPNGKTICMQVVFDKKDKTDGQMYDELRVVEFDVAANTKREISFVQRNGNKLYDYYLCTITPDKQDRVYGLGKALSVQATLDLLGQPAKVLGLDAKDAPKKSALADIADLSPRQLAALLSETTQPRNAGKILRRQL